MIQHSCPTIESDDITSVLKTLKSKKIASLVGSLLFSKNLKKFFKAKKVYLTPSGTEAIKMAINFLNIKKGDEIIVPAYICQSVISAIESTKAKPIPVDIVLSDCNISYEDTVRKISPRTRAIILPHLFGNFVQNINKFQALGKPIIEDVAQAIGGEYLGRKLGSFGDLAICSFYATKVITTGEGGALIINSDKFKGTSVNKSFYKMPDLQSALGLSQLEKIKKLNQRRKELFKIYRTELRKIPKITLVDSPLSINYRCIIETENASAISRDLKAKGVMAEKYTSTAFNYLKLDPKKYPNVAYADKRFVSLPIYPSLSPKKVKLIVSKLGEVIKK